MANTRLERTPRVTNTPIFQRRKLDPLLLNSSADPANIMKRKQQAPMKSCTITTSHASAGREQPPPAWDNLVSRRRRPQVKTPLTYKDDTKGHLILWLTCTQLDYDLTMTARQLLAWTQQAGKHQPCSEYNANRNTRLTRRGGTWLTFARQAGASTEPGAHQNI